MNEPMDILVTVDENYLKPLKVMLFSMYEHHKNQQFTIWLIHKRIPTAKLVELENFITDFNWQLKEIKVEPNFLKMLQLLKGIQKRCISGYCVVILCQKPLIVFYI